MPSGRGGIVPGDPGVVIVVLVGFVADDMRAGKAAEPGVSVSGVVEGQVENDQDIALMAEAEELPQVLHGAEGGIDLVIIGHVIFVIGRGFKDRRQPDAFNTEACAGEGIPVVQVIQTVDDPPQVADTVPVGIGKGTGEDLIENTVPVTDGPEKIGRNVVDHGFTSVIQRIHLRQIVAVCRGGGKKQTQQQDREDQA